MSCASVVLPVYKSEKNIKPLTEAISTTVASIWNDYEIIFVNDGSPDESWKVITELAANDRRVKAISLSRNFGQHNAIIAGLQHTKGDWVIVMDCDFQDNPKYIPELYAEAGKGFEIVYAQRANRSDGIKKKIFNAVFYSLFSYLTDSKFDGSIGNYGIYSRKAVDAVTSMKEPFKIFSLMMRWVGFASSSIKVEHGVRYAGKSSYTFSKLMNLALTIVFTYSQKPLLLTVKAGIFISVASVFYALYIIIAWYTGFITVIGFSTIIVSIWFLGGMTIFTLGILGMYLGKTFEGVKDRPVFIVDKKINI